MIFTRSPSLTLMTDGSNANLLASIVISSVSAAGTFARVSSFFSLSRSESITLPPVIVEPVISP